MTRRILPQHEQFAYRLAALSDMAPPTSAVSKDFLNQLEQEYKEWIGSKTTKPVVKAEDFGKTEDLWEPPEFPQDGSIGHWPNVEKFLKERYPASHRNFQMGLEEARPLVRGEANTLEMEFPKWWENYQHKQDYDTLPEYETGPEAVAKHGYDPRHVAAGMVLLHCLHNGAWSDRDMEIADDIDLLEKLFDTRVEMQRKTDELAGASSAIKAAERILGIYGPGERTARNSKARERSLDELAQAGYITDGWREWQQGGCIEYAHALKQRYPHLQVGVISTPGDVDDWQHIFVHDGTYAYDSAGRHPLPYTGVHSDLEQHLEHDLDWYDDPDPDLIDLAYQHIDKHKIGPHTAHRTARTDGGDCYEAALRYLLDNADNPAVKLVHGEVAGQGRLKGKTYGHAWIEVFDPDEDEHPWVIDPSNGGDLHMPKDEYYELGKINNTHVYTFEQARQKANEHGIFGPWDLVGTHPNYIESELVPGDDDDAAEWREAHRIAMPAVDAYDTFNGSPRVPFPEVPRTKWYHASPHLLPDDTILTPGGGKSPWGKEMYDYHGGWAERAKWVWLTDNPSDAKTWGKLIYEVEPLDEGPWPWNGPDGESHHVVPRARIIRRLPHAEVFPEHGDCGCERYLDKVAMPVPTTVPKNRNQWVKERARLRKLVEKHGLPLDIVPNYDPDWSNQVYDQNWSWQHLRGGRGSPYADRIDRDRTPGIVYRQRVVEQGDRKIPINYLIHNNDDGNITGILSHFPEGSPYEKPGAVTVTVHPQLKGEGIGTKLMQEAIDRFGVDLESQQYTPYGYELYRKMKRERGEEVPDIFGAEKEKAMRNREFRVAASVADQTIKRLENEFNEWWAGTGRNPDDIDYERDLPAARTGPIANWPTIEEFLAEKYPAAAREDLTMGKEHADPLLRSSLDPSMELSSSGMSYWDWDKVMHTDPYETGPEAVAKHGYDPAEVIAGMLYLHNQSHPFRQEVLNADRQRILDVVKARRKMQKAYDEQQKAALDKAASVLRFAYRVLGADESALWEDERKRLIGRGIPLDEINKLHTEWVLTRKPIDPDTGLPHTPESARSKWVSGWVPFLAEYFPTSSTQRNMFDKVQGHNRAVDEVIRDLIGDDGNPDRLTAGAMALHSMQNGNFALYNKILKLDPDLKSRTKDTMDWFAKGWSVDTSTGMPVNPTPVIQPRPVMQPPVNPMTQPRNPMAQPADTTPKPAPVVPQMSESDRIRLEIQQARAASIRQASTARIRAYQQRVYDERTKQEQE